MALRPAVIELVVDDIPTALAFYRRLGLDVPEGVDDQPHVEVPFGGLRLAFDSADSVRAIDPTWAPPTGGHRMALAFECDAPEQVDSFYTDLVAAGVTGGMEPWDAFWGMRYAVVYDPDGTQIDLFAHLPSAQ